ncbi:MAG: hypothetical protein RSA01_11040 [Clostridium sp.]|uniref:hypothetical protein n=1 Tax=Clostridium sp. TaxID=1506 RepID=UPI002FCBC22F
MKKGYVYIEALVACIITAIMVVSVSKIIGDAKENINYSNEYIRGSSIVKSLGSIYRDGHDVLIDGNGIIVSSPDDVYNFVVNGVKKQEGEYILYCRNGFEEGIKHIKISLVFKGNKYEKINEVVAR